MTVASPQYFLLPEHLKLGVRHFGAVRQHKQRHDFDESEVEELDQFDPQFDTPGILILYSQVQCCAESCYVWIIVVEY